MQETESERPPNLNYEADCVLSSWTIGTSPRLTADSESNTADHVLDLLVKLLLKAIIGWIHTLRGAGTNRCNQTVTSSSEPHRAFRIPRPRSSAPRFAHL